MTYFNFLITHQLKTGFVNLIKVKIIKQLKFFKKKNFKLVELV